MNGEPLSLTSRERAVLAEIADILVPRYGDMPSASDVGLCEGPIDRALGARPELLVPVRDLVARAHGRHAQDVVREIEKDDRAVLLAALQLIVGAFYMLPEVRRLLGYSGQMRKAL
ncbi:gluconate 2-dehydrogenase subunit 3 family protein [Ancylobacter mangrovi]|uniref:gluconate 2-dehydrogenase subunit 3 family protein n=1 Tax=Ancylobacter mangrovi TaxID=2972472 RepID=UPI002162D7DA|nr:gluconate 2-dehydrogenase subunit 3 family protein [Ancylobacter mangrovi]MCS0502965.1 gluconate 2-dehydrogenase subunit 3 family protein [Ancylobacter mangrovi]